MVRIAHLRRPGRIFPLTILLAAVLALGLRPATESAAFAGEDTNAHVWEPRTKSVAVFKNGLGFFMREGQVSLRDGWCLASEIPPASFGTLAIYAMEEENTVDLVGSGPGEIVEFDGRDAPDNEEARRARLEPAIGLKTELRYEHEGQDRTAVGELVSVGPKFAVLEGEEYFGARADSDVTNLFAVPIAGITRMQILDLPLRVHVTGAQKKSPDKSKIGMAYLRKGITWIPDYTLEIVDEDTAQLTLRGTLVNEAEDLIHSDVHLVVGVPHFVHTDHMAPIAIGQVIRTIGRGVTSNLPSQVLTQQVMNRAAIVSNSGTAPQFDSMPPAVDRRVETNRGNLEAAVGNLPELAGPAGTDYTVYTAADLTLRRGEKAILTLLTQKIRYSHVYRWTTPEKMRHFLVLENDASSAWTTGPCLALDGQRPLSEDLLYYTPKGGKTELQVTTAINVAHTKTEREIDRELKAHSPRSNSYFDLVTLEGKLQLRNFDPLPIDVIIDNPVPGKPTIAEAGQISLSSNQLKLTERNGSIRWSLKLEPGEQKTLTYQYERYVPSM